MRVASALCAVLLLLLLVFILENNQRVDTSDFGAHGHLPPGVALLLAAVLGMLLAVMENGVRYTALATPPLPSAGSPVGQVSVLPVPTLAAHPARTSPDGQAVQGRPTSSCLPAAAVMR